MSRRTVREWRAFRKYSKSAMAAQLGVHGSTYRRIEDNPDQLSLSEALRLAEVLDCQVGEIIFFENNPNIMLDKVVHS